MNFRDELHFLKYNLEKTKPEFYQQQLEKFHKLDLHKAVSDNVKWFANHPNLYENHNVYFTIHLADFKNKDLSLKDTVILQEKFNRVATGIFGLKADNYAGLLLSDSFGHLYKLMISTNGDSFSFTLWNDTGSLHLLELKTRNNILSYEECSKIEKVMSNYQRCIINCSDCGVEMSKHNIGGQYFAGRYCKDCWEREWKEKEAKESYN